MTLSPIIYSNVCTDVLWDKSRAHDHDEVVRQHPFSSGKPISDEEARPKKKRISRGRKSDYSDDESADADSINFKDMLRSVETRHSERTKLEQERLETERENLQLARDRQAADLKARKATLETSVCIFNSNSKAREFDIPYFSLSSLISVIGEIVITEGSNRVLGQRIAYMLEISSL